MREFFQFLQNLRNFGLEYFNRYYSVYPGIVTDVSNDPDQRGRIKVKMPTLFGEQEIAQWVLPIANPMAGAKTGAFFPPYLGDTVLILFDHGDLDYPFYIGGFWAQEEMPDSFKESYSNIRGYEFKSGQKILVNETEGKIQIKLSNDDTAFIKIDNTDGAEGIYIEHSGKSNSVVTVKAPTVNINAGTVNLGEGASVHAVIYEALQSWADAHIHPTPVGPSGPPVITFSTLESGPASIKANNIKLKGNT